MYSVYDYHSMIADKERTGAYCRALSASVREESVVVDIGTGLGIWALIACRLGARRVYAIEASSVIELARQIAADNGCQDRIEFIHDLSTSVRLPERADLIVSDVHGVLPFHQHGLKSLIDARCRFLKADGVMIPGKDTVWAAVVEDKKSYYRFFDGWGENSYGFEMQAARRIATNGCRRANLKSEQLLSGPGILGTLDYSRLETATLRGAVEFGTSRAGTVHGFGVWFNSELASGIVLSNTPGDPSLIFGNMFFPLSEEVSVSEGDKVSLQLRADLVGEDYVWTWDTTIERQGQQVNPIVFRQSTFLGDVLEPGQVQKSSARHVPTLNDEGQLERFVLERMNGDLSLEAITNQLRNTFPERFPTFQRALNEVAKVSKRCSR
jgi:protein arginine N-methyltransferase 1